MIFPIYNLQNLRYRFFHSPSIIVGKTLVTKSGILDLPNIWNRPIKKLVDSKLYEDQHMKFLQWKEVGLPSEQTEVASQEKGYEETIPCLF
jgi:hypothetical protein